MDRDAKIIYNQFSASFKKYQETGEFKNAIYWAIKFVDYIDTDEGLRVFIDLVDIFMKKMTYREFIQLFPIIKSYKGYRYEEIDYFATMSYIEAKGIDNLIDCPLQLFMTYDNIDMLKFAGKWLSYADRLHVDHYGISILDAFFKADEYPHDSQGNIITIDKLGKVWRIPDPYRPAPQLRVVK